MKWRFNQNDQGKRNFRGIRGKRKFGRIRVKARITQELAKIGDWFLKGELKKNRILLGQFLEFWRYFSKPLVLESQLFLKKAAWLELMAICWISLPPGGTEWKLKLIILYNQLHTLPLPVSKPIHCSPRYVLELHLERSSFWDAVYEFSDRPAQEDRDWDYKCPVSFSWWDVDLLTHSGGSTPNTLMNRLWLCSLGNQKAEIWRTWLHKTKFIFALEKIFKIPAFLIAGQ